MPYFLGNSEKSGIGIKISLAKITIRIRDALMMNYALMEVLRWDRKTILKPPDWNRPRQMEIAFVKFCKLKSLIF